MNYQKQAKDFLSNAGVEMKINFFKNDYHFEDDKESNIFRDIYKVVFKRKKQNRIDNKISKFTVIFGNSIQATNNNEKPDEYDILACLQKYDLSDFSNFCLDFGYEEFCKNCNRYNKKSIKIYKACIKEFEKVLNFFSDEELELLRDIN